MYIYKENSKSQIQRIAVINLKKKEKKKVLYLTKS